MMTIRESSMSLNRGGVRVVLPVMAIVAAATSFGGYGDLPDTFDASTGYVTLNANDGTGAGNQSFFLKKNWSDGNAPHAGTNYYVRSNLQLGTPHVDSDVTAQLAVDSDCLTFKGDTLVLGGCIWHLNGTYPFTFPDLRLLPGSKIDYTAFKSSLKGTATVYGTSGNPFYIRLNLEKWNGVQPFGMAMKGGEESCISLAYGAKTPL